MDERLTVDFRRPVPVFPLPDCVMLPHTLLPLHIFEPRYRRMVDDALDSSGLIAMALFSGHVSDEQYLHGRPPLRSCVCLGYIVQYEKLRERRYLLLLQGVCRARIAQEVEHSPYRLCRLKPVDLGAPADRGLSEYRRRIVALANDPAMDRHDGIGSLRLQLVLPVSAKAAVDIAIAALCPGGDQRYAMLAEPDVLVRARWIVDRLEALRAEHAPRPAGER